MAYLERFWFMTLVGTTHKIIFIKTHKTAGTSVEAALEKTLLGLPGRHYQPFTASVHGFVTARPKNYDTPWHQLISQRNLKKMMKTLGWDAIYFKSILALQNHSLPDQIKASMPLEFWETATKVTICRKPLDIIISQFFWENPKAKSGADWRPQLEMFATTVHPKPINQAIANLREPVTVLRYESLTDDFEKLISSIGLQTEGLPTFKSGFKPTDLQTGQLTFKPDTLKRIRENWGAYADRFGYEI
jgi:hypothetical protein